MLQKKKLTEIENVSAEIFLSKYAENGNWSPKWKLAKFACSS